MVSTYNFRNRYMVSVRLGWSSMWWPPSTREPTFVETRELGDRRMQNLRPKPESLLYDRRDRYRRRWNLGLFSPRLPRSPKTNRACLHQPWYLLSVLCFLRGDDNRGVEICTGQSRSKMSGQRTELRRPNFLVQTAPSKSVSNLIELLSQAFESCLVPSGPPRASVPYYDHSLFHPPSFFKS